jgi:uncharacterized membrane protein YphA (DoxX/SURF4 family)
MKPKILFVICLLFGVMFINAGLDKFFHYMPMPPDMPKEMLDQIQAFQTIGWLMPLVAIAEIVGGILFIIPRLRALGAIIIFPIVLGILISNITLTPSGIPIAAVLLIINIWIIFDSRGKYSSIIR